MINTKPNLFIFLHLILLAYSTEFDHYIISHYNEVHQNDQQFCQFGSYWVEGHCSPCPLNTKYNQIKHICQPTCLKNSAFINGPCSCNDGYYLIQSQCEKCQLGTRFDDQIQTCVSICGKNEIFNGKACACMEQYLRIDGKCSKCGKNQVFNQTESKCVCDKNYFLIDGLCSKCEKGTKYDRDLQGCVSVCQKVNQIFDGDKCVCSIGLYLVEGQCSNCPDSTRYNNKTQKCDPKCEQNSVYKNGVCQCIKEFYPINNKCQKCPKGTKFDEQLQNCASICKENQVFEKDQCVCQNDFYRIGGLCAKCTGIKIFNQSEGKCNCPVGYEQKQNECLSLCEENQVYFEGECFCSEGYYPIKGVCGQCPEHSYYYPGDQSCFCPFGFQLTEEGCIKNCSSREFFNKQKRECVPYCEQFLEVWVNEKCECAPGFSRDKFTKHCHTSCGPFEQRVKGKCQCIEGYHRGVMVPCVPIVCPPGHKWNQKRRECQSICGINEIFLNGECPCSDNHTRDTKTGICLKNCEDGKLRINSNCRCPIGNKEIDGKCTQCPPLTQYVLGYCVCYNGLLPFNGKCQAFSCGKDQVWDPLARTCKCKTPLIWMFGSCRYMEQCDVNEYWNGKACACKSGYVKVQGKCVVSHGLMPICPSNSGFNGINCVCLSGFYPIQKGKCLPCPSNTHWNGKKCQLGDYACASGFIWDLQRDKCVPEFKCGKNQFWDGNHCRCKQGFFWIESECKKCPYKTFFDGLACSKTKVDEACLDPYQFWNGQECVCLEGYFPIEDKCVHCPKYTYWDGYCCKPKIGHSQPLTVVAY